jgi:hypothetical protein
VKWRKKLRQQGSDKVEEEEERRDPIEEESRDRPRQRVDQDPIEEESRDRPRQRVDQAKKIGTPFGLNLQA